MAGRLYSVENRVQKAFWPAPVRQMVNGKVPPMTSPQKQSSVEITKALLRICRHGSLATLMPGTGAPYCSLVNVASAPGGQPVILISRLARHTQNIEADARVSVLLHDVGSGDPLEDNRIMVSGLAIKRTGDEAAAVRRRYLALHPAAADFVEFTDFAFYEVQPENVHLVAGFGRIVDVAPERILTDLTDATALIEAEAGIVEHMNEDHLDATALYATKLLGAEEGAWRMTGVDPEGADLACDGKRLRLPFRERVTNANEARKALVALVAEARAAT